MRENTFVVIGSNCFTGSHIVDRLLEDPSNHVVGVSRSPEYKSTFLPYRKKADSQFSFHQINLVTESERLMSLLDKIEPSYVINVAALSEVGLSNYQPVEYFQTNTVGVVSFCNQLRDRDYLKRYIHISSAEVYGSCSSPLLEAAPLSPSTPYAVSKAAADLCLLTFFKNFRFPVNLIRSTNVYGACQQLYKIIPRSIIYLRTGKKIELHGGGRAAKTWIHVRDLAEGIWQVIQRGGPGEIYHFSDRHFYTVAQLVEKICNLLEIDFRENTISTQERLGQDSQYLLNYSKAQRELGWLPRIPFEEGLKEVIAWIEEDWEEIVNEPHLYVHKV